MSKRATMATVRRLALALPGVEEGTSYGTPAFKVRGKLFARLHQSGEAIVVRVDDDEREMLMKTDPETYYMTDHYIGYPWMLVRLAKVRTDDLCDRLEQSWRRSASKRLIAELDSRGRSL